MRLYRECLLLSAVLGVASPVWGHHSFAMFDLDKEITLEGTVKDVQWANPHVWLEIVVQGDNGAATQWSLEMGTTGMLTRAGWKSSTLKPNDRVKVVINPLKSGEPSGRLVKVILPDGRELGPGGPGPASPPKPAA
jgi:uncharacterized protein DUF6152